MYPFLEIGKISIPMYAIMMMVGFFASFICFYFLIKNNLKKVDIFLFAIYVFLGGVVGAKILAMLVAIPYFFNENFNMFHWVLNSGMVYYGGFAGAFLLGELYIKMYGLEPQVIWDKTVICLPLGQMFGRIGCFCAGCCFGKESEILGVEFKHCADESLNGIKLLPTQLIEAVFCFVLFIILFVFCRKNKKQYFCTFIYCFCYGVFRFVVEFFRGDTSRGVFILSTSQWISIFLIIFGTLLYYTNFKQLKIFQKSVAWNKKYRN